MATAVREYWPPIFVHKSYLRGVSGHRYKVIAATLSGNVAQVYAIVTRVMPRAAAGVRYAKAWRSGAATRPGLGPAGPRPVEGMKPLPWVSKVLPSRSA